MIDFANLTKYATEVGNVNEDNNIEMINCNINYPGFEYLAQTNH